MSNFLPCRHNRASMILSLRGKGSSELANQPVSRCQLIGHFYVPLASPGTGLLTRTVPMTRTPIGFEFDERVHMIGSREINLMKTIELSITFRRIRNN
ncbi:hypothetical protein EAG_10245 [Camponotus floridanus]|uniref:Uncharacterized protein n=1 Tax=Camponotus floridanus TaxID=104421 RepID=E2AQV4_CAMFO|nr:hypothetical protein EAG_10245 [Camponotus floridanus]